MDNFKITECLLKGTLPEISQDKIISFPYEPCEEADPSSSEPEQIACCLKAGIVPELYKDKLEFKEVFDMLDYRRGDKLGIDAMSNEEKRQLALQGFFVRNLEENIVFCPEGCTLRKKSNKKEGYVRYFSKASCSKCEYKCFISRSIKWKEVDFPAGFRVKGPGTRVIFVLHA